MTDRKEKYIICTPPTPDWLKRMMLNKEPVFYIVPAETERVKFERERINPEW
jgi:hypothetical protein